MSKPSDKPDPAAGRRHRALGIRRPAESWIDEDVDFDIATQRSRTVDLSSGEPEDAEPAAGSDKRKLPSMPSVRSVSMPSIPTNTKDLVHGTANQIDQAALKAADKAKDVGNKSADVARVGAEKVNKKRRAGLPPGRDHERRAKPRVAPVAVGRRPRRKIADRVGSHPDRIVLWAVILGILLILIAATSSSKAATPSANGVAHQTLALDQMSS